MSVETEVEGLRQNVQVLSTNVAELITLATAKLDELEGGGGGGTGQDGAPGSKWLLGSTVPASNLGIDGDFYIRNNATIDVYGPKTAGSWGNVVFGLKGAKGDQGETGTGGGGSASKTELNITGSRTLTATEIANHYVTVTSATAVTIAVPAVPAAGTVHTLQGMNLGAGAVSFSVSSGQILMNSILPTTVDQYSPFELRYVSGGWKRVA